MQGNSRNVTGAPRARLGRPGSLRFPGELFRKRNTPIHEDKIDIANYKFPWSLNSLRTHEVRLAAEVYSKELSNEPLPCSAAG